MAWVHLHKVQIDKIYQWYKSQDATLGELLMERGQKGRKLQVAHDFQALAGFTL
jgi:hypothetical protein